MAASEFKPALIIVDLQEDFCPPDGSLAVANGRDIVSTVNTLLSLPFTFKVATKDWHPADHVSFASNHPGAEPFTSFTTIVNPHNSDETYETRLWPVHCVQDTPGAALIPELDVNKVDSIITKGLHSKVEMYSAFYDPLTKPRVADSGLAAQLKKEGITHCYVVGLAADYCVRATALDAASEGFTTYIIEDGTRAVDEKTWGEEKKKVLAKGVGLISMSGEELEKVRNLA